jgi:mannosyltransferase
MTATAVAPPARALGGRWLTGLAVFVGATVLAALMSPSVSLWIDESVTISAAQRTPAELWLMLQRIDAVHGLYYAFMSGWIDVFGASPFSLRLPSALAAGGTALGVFLIARAVAGPTTALVAAVVCATIPRLTWGGIEARPFIFSALAAVWASYLLVRAMQRRRASGWIAYAVVAALGVGVNIYLVLLVVGHAVTVLILARKDRAALVGFAVSAVAAALVTAPLVLLVRSQQAQLGGNGDRNPLSIARKIVVNQFFLGETPDPDPSAMWWTRTWQVAAVLAALLGLAAIVVAIIRPPAAGDDKRWMLALTLPWMVVPTVVIAAYAVAIAPIYQPRYLTFTVPAAALLIAAGVRAAGRRWFTAAWVVAYVLCISVVFVSQRTPFAKSGSDWAAVADIIAESSEAGDAVYFAPRFPGQVEVVEMTTRRIAQAYPHAFIGLDDLTTLQSGAETATLDGFSRPIAEAKSALAGRDRVWALFYARALPDVREESEELFAGLGLRPRIVWDGPSTLIVEYSRED